MKELRYTIVLLALLIIVTSSCKDECATFNPEFRINGKTVPSVVLGVPDSSQTDLYVEVSDWKDGINLTTDQSCNSLVWRSGVNTGKGSSFKFTPNRPGLKEITLTNPSNEKSSRKFVRCLPYDLIKQLDKIDEESLKEEVVQEVSLPEEKQEEVSESKPQTPTRGAPESVPDGFRFIGYDSDGQVQLEKISTSNASISKQSAIVLNPTSSNSNSPQSKGNQTKPSTPKPTKSVEIQDSREITQDQAFDRIGTKTKDLVLFSSESCAFEKYEEGSYTIKIVPKRILKLKEIVVESDANWTCNIELQNTKTKENDELRNVQIIDALTPISLQGLDQYLIPDNEYNLIISSSTPGALRNFSSCKKINNSNSDLGFYQSSNPIIIKIKYQY